MIKDRKDRHGGRMSPEAFARSLLKNQVCKTCKWLPQDITCVCTCEETPAINVFGYEDTFGCNFWRAK